MGESCRLRILATWCSNKLSSGVQPLRRGSRPFLRVGERERRRVERRGGEERERERERETSRAEEETTKEEERWEETRLQKEERST